MYFILTTIYIIGGILNLAFAIQCAADAAEHTPFKGEILWIIKVTVFGIIGIGLVIIWPISDAVAIVGLLLAGKLIKTPA